MKPLVTFYVGRNSSFSSMGKIYFNVPLIQTGSVWNMTTATFTAPQTGVYVFSLSCAAKEYQKFDVLVNINGMATHEKMLPSTLHNGIHISSRNIVISLAADDEVQVALASGSLYSDSDYPTSFARFVYEPLDGRKVVWAVHQRSLIRGQLNPFPFDEVAINIGNGWNSTANRFEVPYSGVYQFHLTVTMQPSASIVYYQLLKNGISYANMFTATTNHNGYQTRSRSIMIEASIGDTFNIATVGDTFNIATVTATDSYSNANRLISFSGFLLCP